MTAAPPLQRRLRPSATDAAFRRLIADASADVRALVDRLTAGELDPAEWQEAMLETLAQAHAEAGYRGRLRAGDLAPFDRDDERFGYLVAQEEQQYLWGFQRDIEEGNLDAGKIERRAQLYVDRLVGTANEALALVAGDDEVWIWTLGPTDHCPDCVRLEANSPYRGKPPTMPRMNNTQCYQNCQCSCQASSGLETFAP